MQVGDDYRTDLRTLARDHLDEQQRKAVLVEQEGGLGMLSVGTFTAAREIEEWERRHVRLCRLGFALAVLGVAAGAAAVIVAAERAVLP